MRRYTVSLSEEAADWLTNAVETSGMSRSELVDLAVLKLAKRQGGYTKRRGTISQRSAR